VTITDARWVLPDWHYALKWSKARNSQGIKVILDILGESSRKEKEILNTVNDYTKLIENISAERLDAAVTIKITSLGYLLDRDICLRNVLEIGQIANDSRVGFEIDMEGRSMVDFTLNSARSCSERGLQVTIALQAYLNRTGRDLSAMIENGVRVRLVKGAYAGDLKAFQEIQKRFMGFAETLSASSDKFALGTHDPEILSWVKVEMNRTKDKLELGMLRGLSDSSKLDLDRQGWEVAEYVPFGPNAIAYVERRLQYLQQLKAQGRSPAP
jgi:proline dehydrogenase